MKFEALPPELRKLMKVVVILYFASLPIAAPIFLYKGWMTVEKLVINIILVGAAAYYAFRKDEPK